MAAHCSGCSACFESHKSLDKPVTEPELCESWCSSSPKIWLVKCASNSCKACAPCSNPPPPPPFMSEEEHDLALRRRPRKLDLSKLPHVPDERELTLKWSDEFEHCPNGRPDPSTWQFENGYKRNQGVQYYREENAQCKNGILTITALHHESGDGAVHSEPVHYTSASMFTSQQATGLLTLGQYDARIRITRAANSWPAWWAVGSNANTPYGPWPQIGEIDIMAYHQSSMFMRAAYAVDGNSHDGSNCHWLPERSQSKLNQRLKVTDAWARTFHDFTLTWTESSLDFFVDGVHIERAWLADVNLKSKLSNPYLDPDRLPLIMFLNLAVPPKIEWDAAGIEWPISMEVDYVRYFERSSPPPPKSPPTPPASESSPSPPGPLQAVQAERRWTNASPPPAFIVSSLPRAPVPASPQMVQSKVNVNEVNMLAYGIGSGLAAQPSWVFFVVGAFAGIACVPLVMLYRRITTQRYSKVGSSEKRIKAQLKCSLRKFINDSEEGRVYLYKNVTISQKKPDCNVQRTSRVSYDSDGNESITSSVDGLEEICRL